MNKIFSIFIILCFILSCGSPLPEVHRTDVKAKIDISGSWNDTDSRMVSEEMINEIFKGGWLSEFRLKHPDKNPRIIVGMVKNKTYEHINVGTFIKDLEKAITNSRKAVMVASKEERKEIREEKEEQAMYATEETMKGPGGESGADYMLKGEINAIEDSAGGTKLVYYQVTMELINITNNEKVWMGDKQIKKVIERSDWAP
jgi:uncharacterized protein (TIGR02722 family)